jgi:hypothetical protein
MSGSSYTVFGRGLTLAVYAAHEVPLNEGED